MEKICHEQKGHYPARATLGEPTFHTFPYKTLRTVYMRKKARRLGQPFWMVGHPPSWPIFLHINTLVQPARSTGSNWVRARASAVFDNQDPVFRKRGILFTSSVQSHLVRMYFDCRVTFILRVRA